MQIPDSEIRDAAAAVFSDPAFHRVSLLDRLGAWLLEVLEALFVRIGPARPSPALFWTVVTLTGVLVLLILGRALYGIRLSRSLRGKRLSGESDGTRGFDLSKARDLAARGDYTAAAHALYSALLSALASRDGIELHASKTIGDYIRDLRKRASRALPAFRDFAHAYEVVIYGIGFCDRERYERLHGLAERMMHSHA